MYLEKKGHYLLKTFYMLTLKHLNIGFLSVFQGAVPANFVRVCVPKFLMGYAAALALFYHISYNPKVRCIPSTHLLILIFALEGFLIKFQSI